MVASVRKLTLANCSLEQSFINLCNHGRFEQQNKGKGWIYLSLRDNWYQGCGYYRPSLQVSQLYLHFTFIVIYFFHPMICFWGGVLKKKVNRQIHFFFTLATRGRLYHPVCALKFKISQKGLGLVQTGEEGEVPEKHGSSHQEYTDGVEWDLVPEEK